MICITKLGVSKNTNLVCENPSAFFQSLREEPHSLKLIWQWKNSHGFLFLLKISFISDKLKLTKAMYEKLLCVLIKMQAKEFFLFLK